MNSEPELAQLPPFFPNRVANRAGGAPHPQSHLQVKLQGLPLPKLFLRGRDFGKATWDWRRKPARGSGSLKLL